jgi:CDP-paratose synthetase
MKIIILGASSNLAQYLTNALLNKRHEIFLIYRNTYQVISSSNHNNNVVDYENINNLYHLFENVDICINTLGSYGRLNEDFTELKYVNYELPYKYYKICNDFKVSYFLNCGTALPPEYNEYSLSKSFIYEKMKSTTFGLFTKFVELKLQHFYGNNDNETTFIKKTIKQCLQNTESIHIKTPNESREFLHISDLIKAIVVIINNCNDFQYIINSIDIGSKHRYRIIDVCNYIKYYTDTKTTFEYTLGDIRKSPQIPHSILDNLYKYGWEENMPLEDGIQNLVSYMSGESK